MKKAREALGDRAPALSKGGWGPRHDGGDRILGKRRRGGDDASSSDEEEVPEEVRRIPMPRDTPPPIPKAVLDEWYAKRRAKRAAAQGSQNANGTPLGGDRQPPAPVEAKTVYEAKPVVRDLKKEAVTAFVPAAVRMKMSKGKGEGGLMEPEEADRLEREGYLKMKGGEGASTGEEQGSGMKATVEDAEED